MCMSAFACVLAFPQVRLFMRACLFVHPSRAESMGRQLNCFYQIYDYLEHWSERVYLRACAHFSVFASVHQRVSTRQMHEDILKAHFQQSAGARLCMRVESIRHFFCVSSVTVCDIKSPEQPFSSSHTILRFHRHSPENTVSIGSAAFCAERMIILLSSKYSNRHCTSMHTTAYTHIGTPAGTHQHMHRHWHPQHDRLGTEIMHSFFSKSSVLSPSSNVIPGLSLDIRTRHISKNDTLLCS